ncbi:hypothetical protein METBIDRAFT_37309 [Metschnikowia bicuspidata var. bicuspidata NRRL YB-4993]|uniref:DNA primase large subunit n=1 Tax=Metschnikowia bicuspidata var. bicuspidata NRRL YB-4993 TaxID=869754 RepID=A0A1A0HJY1_9ASCO|nr:hypothetical protein METBIDRAFT_37309 [Metschnikowia bicuspidata var. bicuspidata NRRL YB-4993]OBA24192.1 hypothetical protein METBIDRAFT_37309 [Metschnikowia bicuspidata var. bicuspidata NRRL YB-4993]
MFRQTKRRTAGRRNFEDVAVYADASRELLYPSRLSLYDTPPTEEITLEQFESWAIDRLKVLIEIESCLARAKTFKETEAIVRPLLLRFLPLSPLAPTAALDQARLAERRKDYYSHYTLRLVFCRTEELRRKFARNEATLFRIRYAMLQPAEQREFARLNAARLAWDYISDDEKLALLDCLYAASGPTIRAVLSAERAGDSSFSLTPEQLRLHIREKESFVKLPFEKVPQLVALRQVYLSRGSAYIPAVLQASLLQGVFQDLLAEALVKTLRALPRLEEDDRLLPLLNNLSRNFSSVQYEASGDPAQASDITAASVSTPQINRHYPLCATHLQRNLKLNSHLKYDGRQQLGLFLKGIGLNADEALKFWANEFTKTGKISMDAFNKEYRYNIRHIYGLEGSRVNYKPYDCSTILAKKRPQRGEFHGCPYRDLPPELLVGNLNDLGITDQHDINNILEDVNKNSFTVACTKVFEITHKLQMARAAKPENLHITHPNLYFDRSRQLEKNETKAKAPGHT